MRSQRRLVSPLSAVNLQPNTFIGGVATEIPTKAALATKLAIAESNILYFAVVGSDIEARININYSFRNIWAGSAITRYIDEDDLVTGCGFNFCSYLKKIKLLGVTTPITYMYRDCPLLKVIHHPLLVGVLNTRNIFNMDSLTHVILNELNYIGAAGSSGTDFTFFNCPKLKKVYLPECLNFGDTHQFDNTIRNTTGEMYVHSSMFTINNGGLEGDLAARQSAGVVIKDSSLWSFTPPNAVTNLSISTLYATVLQLNFTPPSSVNAIDYYECYANGVYKNDITASGGHITGLNPDTTYTITVKAVDVFYNKSEFSNSVSDTTNATYVIPTENIVSYYKLEGNALDVNGVNNGTPTAITYESGLLGQRAIFNGTTSSIILTNNASLQLSQGSIVTVINSTNAGGSYRGIVAKQNAYALFLTSGVLVVYNWGSASGITVGERSTGMNLNDGLNHVIALTFNSGVVNGTKIYVDGSLVLTTSIVVSNQTRPLVIGAAGDIGSIIQMINAKIDDSAVFNSILTAGEVSEITSKLQSGQSLI